MNARPRNVTCWTRCTKQRTRDRELGYHPFCPSIFYEACACQREKQSIRNALNKANQVRESARVKVRQIKENSRVSSIEEIDGQIKRLEEKINSSELTEKEEQESIENIRQLVKSRETVRSLRRQLDDMQSQENNSEDLMDQLKDIDSKMDECTAQEKEINKQLDAIQKKREEEDIDVHALIEEKEECWQVLCALRQKRKEINDAFTVEMDHYKQELKEYHKAKRELEQKLQGICCFECDDECGSVLWQGK